MRENGGDAGGAGSSDEEIEENQKEKFEMRALLRLLFLWRNKEEADVSRKRNNRDSTI